MQTLQQHQSKKPLVRCSVGSMVVGAGQRLLGVKAPPASGRLLVGSGRLGPERELPSALCPDRAVQSMEGPLQGMKGWLALESQFRQPSSPPSSVRREVYSLDGLGQFSEGPQETLGAERLQPPVRQ